MFTKKISRVVFCALACTGLITSPLYAGGNGDSPKPLDGMHPIVLSHGLLGWGEESTGLTSIINYWGGMDDVLRENGATVYAPAKSPGNSNMVRGQELKDRVLYWMAANNVQKVHYLGHSQGPLDVRYMVANLGMANKTASVTSLNGVNRGTGLADGLAPLFPEDGILTGLIEVFVNLLYVEDDSDARAVIDSLSTDGMALFNSFTPDAPGVRYYSYGSVINGPNLIQHPIGSLLYHFTGQNAGNTHTYANDGFVPLSSQKWGEWKGGPDVPWYSNGVDHLQCANTLYLGEAWYDVEAYFMKMALNAKAGQ